MRVSAARVDAVERSRQQEAGCVRPCCSSWQSPACWLAELMVPWHDTAEVTLRGAGRGAGGGGGGGGSDGGGCGGGGGGGGGECFWLGDPSRAAWRQVETERGRDGGRVEGNGAARLA
eukprot:645610-Rhodomonas_salina.1